MNCCLMVFLGSCLFWGCAAKRTSPPQPHVQVDWNELASEQSEQFSPHPEIHFEQLLTSEKLRELPPALRANYFLAKLAVNRNLERPEILADGVIGKVDNAVLFAAMEEQVPDMDRLYHIMIQVLSERFACFIRERTKTTDSYEFKCRDSRKVVFKWKRQDSWVQFFGRQYDATGSEIFITKKEDSQAHYAPAARKRRNRVRE